MNNRERTLAVLNYQPYDRLPIVHFGYWDELLDKWVQEGHLTYEEREQYGEGSALDRDISRRLGFDYNYQTMFYSQMDLRPAFERTVLEEQADGFSKVLTGSGTIELYKPGMLDFPPSVDYLLKGRKEWEELYLPKLQFSVERIDWQALEAVKAADSQREYPLGLHCGSLYGAIRGWLTVVGSAYMWADDEALMAEIIATLGQLCYDCVKAVLASGARFDFAHFWEDICFKNGPLVNPAHFRRYVGPQYKRITELVNSYGINIVSLDCDGKIDALVPIWLENGVNTMFPIEVGTWDASIAPWRAQYGRELRGVGGLNKHVFAADHATVDAEIERLRPLVDLGGYIPCPDHRLPPETKWENLQHYSERMRSIYG